MIDSKAGPYGVLLLRVALGAMFIAHACLKLFVFTMPGTVQFFESLGLPAWFAWLTVVAELGGGAFLVLGIYARIIALLLVPTLVGAAVLVHNKDWLFSSEGGGWEFPVFWAVALIVLAFLGDGALALRPTRFGSERRAA